MDNLEKLKTTAGEIEQNGSTFMEPKIENKNKKGAGRPKLSDEEKALRAREKAEKQKKAAAGSDSKSTENSQGSASQSGPAAGFQIPSKQVMMPLFMGLSGVAVKYAQDPRAAMTPDEMDNFAEFGGKLLDKYAPGVFDKYGLEATMLIMMGMYGARVVALKKVVAYDRAQAVQAQAEQFKSMQTEPTKADAVKSEMGTVLQFKPPTVAAETWTEGPQPA